MLTFLKRFKDWKRTNLIWVMIDGATGLEIMSWDSNLLMSYERDRIKWNILCSKPY